MDETPNLTASDSLRGLMLGLSVSDSADLARLGLSSSHAELAVGEIGRAVLVAGGSIVYGGRLKPSGFTQFLMHEVRRYGRGQDALTLVLAEPEHRVMTREELREADRELGTKGRLVFLDSEGAPIEDFLATKGAVPETDQSEAERASGYGAMRRYLAERSDARLVVGGQLEGFRGAMPGIVEEAIASIRHVTPLYIAAGFGGAAALVAKALGVDDLSWAPDDFPERPEDQRIEEGLDQLAAAQASSDWSVSLCRLSDLERGQLAASHRPGEIASIVVSGLSRLTN